MSADRLDVAIIGVGAKTPIGLTAAEFWEGVLGRRDGIREVPPGRWDPGAYYDPDPKSPDRTYSKIGGFVTGFAFDRKRYRLPPAVAESMDFCQQLALAAVDEALEDAGPRVDRERCAVVLGNSLGGDRREFTSARVLFPEFVRALVSAEGWDDLPADVRRRLLDAIERSYKNGLPPVTEDTMPGELSNVMAGRIANVLDLGGSNYTVDAACASSLAAVASAARALRSGECDVAVTGGSDTSMGAPTYVKFCKIGALSPDGSRPFDAGANGFVMGEGAAVFVLKRIEDARRDGDRVYAVIRSVGGSSDGRGKGITAPNPAGQRRAVRRAYEAAGVDPASVDLIEAHGTSTRVGDATEAAVLHDIWGDARKGRPVALGSVKSQIGHLKSAAGAVGLLKTALAIHRRTLPPTINFENENPDCHLAGSSFRPQTEPADWDEPRHGAPRRAAVSAFGFGGTNFHLVLEQYMETQSNVKSLVPSNAPVSGAPGGTIAMADSGSEPGSPAVTGPSTSAGATTITTTPATTTTTTKKEVTREAVEKALVEVLCAKTGYDAGEIEMDFELEADLGVDTVKQAEILAAVRERYGLPRDEKFRLADYPRLADLVAYVVGRIETTGRTGAGATTITTTPASVSTTMTTTTTTSREEETGDPADPEIAGEVIRASAESRDDLIARLRTLAERLASGASLRAAARECIEGPAGPWRVAIAAITPAEASDRIALALEAVETGKGRSLLPNKGVFLRSPDDPVPPTGVAFLFPGQGSQWVGMCKALARRYPVVAETLRRADDVMAPILGRPLTSYIFGNGFGESGADPEAALRMTTITQPAMLACDIAIARLLAQHGVRPDAVAGHSLGEYAACVVAGVIGFDDSLRIVAARGREMAAATPQGGDPGWMAAVAAPLQVVEEVIRATDGYLVAANKNSPSQTIVAGATEAVQRAMAAFAERGISCMRLPVSHAFHTAVVASASAPLRRVLDAAAVGVPRIPILSNVTADPYPADAEAIKDLLARQVASPVEFIEIVRHLNAGGAGIFVEAGPKRALTGFVIDILKGRPVVACPTNLPKRGEVRSFLEALAMLWVERVPVRFAGDLRPDLDGDRTAISESAPAAKRSRIDIAEPAPLAPPTGSPPRHASIKDRGDAPPPARTPIVVSGMALGLPGSDDPFARENFDRMLAGHTFFEPVPGEIREGMARRNIVRLVKDDRGEPRLAAVDNPDEVIRLAARGRPVRLIEEYGIPEEIERTYDATTRLAVAATIEALRDAALPLARSRRPTRNGGFVGAGWRLPDAVGRETGVIFASAFPGYDRFAREILRREVIGTDEPFSRTFLLEVLAMGHAHVASLIGALGPNLQVNAACASTSLAIATAEDWIRAGRCRRVIVVGADDVTNDALLPWIGAGFLATGAAATDERPEDAALPFDRRRHGMLLGMGAVALIVETADAATERGITPLAEVLATRCANSGGHALRLNPDHVAEVVDALVGDVEHIHGIRRDDVADRCLFMSHETYTPARGGSASAEVAALRKTFGAKYENVLVANTKGFTGHPMGAGLEDAVALTALVRREVPPIPNHREADPELGSLRLSKGGRAKIDYVLRLAAGFGSQIACTMYHRIADALDGRVDTARHLDWVAATTGFERPEVFVDGRVLRAAPGTPATKPTRPRSRIDIGDLGGGFRAWGVVTERITPPAAAPVEGPAVVLHDGSARAADVMRAIETRGVAVVPVPYAPPDAEGTRVEHEIAGRLHPHGERVRGVINLLGLPSGRTPPAFSEPDAPHGRARFLYHVARVLERTRGGPPGDLYLVTATSHGGNCGIGDAPGTTDASVAAALGGVTKALAREWPAAAVRVADFAQGAAAGEIAQGLLSAVTTPGGDIEIGFAPGGPVTTALSRTVALGDATRLDADSVVLLTGGAGGITAAIGAEIARRHRCRIAVLDIVARPPEGAENLDLDRERASIRSRLAATGERVTPSRVDAELAPLRRAKNAAAALAGYRAAGASAVHYESCDLADRSAVEAAIANVRRAFGRIDGVVHGAGAEESRPVSSKTPAGFDRVFRGKALGALHLWDLVRGDRPAFFMFFSSVAGRFGNPGQVDYCAANEVAARLAWHITGSGCGTRALAVDWTGWDQIGMAVAGGMRTILVERGVDLLPPSIGVPLAADLIDRGVIGEVVVCGRLGDMAKPRYVAESDAPAEIAPSPSPPAAARPTMTETAIPGATVTRREVDRVEVTLALDPKTQTFLSDHVIEGVPVLPGVVGLELMAEAARVLTGAPRLTAVDVRFDRPVKVHPGRPVTVVARALRSGSAVQCTLESISTAATGRPLEAAHFHARFDPSTSEAAGPGVFCDLSERGPEAEEVYRYFFHGETFRVIERATRIGEEGVVVRASVPCGGSAEIAGPRQREIALQAAGLWAMCRRGVMTLPHRVDRAERLAVPEPGTPVIARVRARPASPAGSAGDAPPTHSFDVDLIGTDGTQFERLRGVTLIETGTLAGGRPTTVSFADSPEHTEVRLDVLAAAAGDLAAGYLGPAESSLFRQIGSRKRRVDWLGGRLAAKRLVADHLIEIAGVRVAEKDIGVVADTHGAPDVRIAGRTDLERLVPHVAISHGAGRAIAVLAPRNSGARVGVDVEAIEPRGPAFVRHVFTDGEARLTALSGVNGGTATLLWTLKEAVTKALGVGMTVDPRDIEVTDLRDGAASVTLKGDAEARRAAIGGGDLAVRYAVDSAASTAWAVLDVDPSAAVSARHPAPAVPPGLIASRRLVPGAS